MMYSIPVYIMCTLILHVLTCISVVYRICGYGGQTEFPKCRGGGEEKVYIYNVITFQKSRGARPHLGGARAHLGRANAPPHPP